MYDQYANDIFRYIYVRVSDQQIAEDLTADVFTRAWNKLDTFDFKQSRPWLYKIAQNIVIDFWRRKKPVPIDDEAMEVVSDLDQPEVTAEKSLANEKLQAGLKKLPEDMQSVVTMRFLLGYSAKQTAKNLGLTEANVRVIQYRALKKLREHLS